MTNHNLKDGPTKYRSDIDGLRAIAVLLVVGFHAFPEWVKGGFIGVDIFFVISGFLISTIIITNLKEGNFSIVDFYGRRVRRIFPSLLIVMVFCLIFGWFVLLPTEYAYLGEHIAAGAGFISNLVLWQESGYFDVSADLKPLLHLWSLGIEEQFYIFWPLILWIAIAKRVNLKAVLFISCSISFVLNLLMIGSDPVATFYLPFSRFWELICGALLANYMLNQRESIEKTDSLVKSNLCSITGLGLIALGILLITKKSTFPGFLAVLPVAGTSLLILANNQGWINRLVLSNKLLVWIGLISFPLYLWHWPLLVFSRILENGTPDRSTRIVVVVLSMLLAWFTYRAIEKPIRFGKNRTVITTALAIVMLVIGLSGYTLYVMEGIPQRYSKSYQLYVENIDFKWPAHVRFEQCHIQSQNISIHDPICRDIKRPLIAIWGDSHASSLYPGIKKLEEQRTFGIEQLTTAGCPPLLDLIDLRYKKNCNQINQSVISALSEDQPNVLILHAAWRHEQYPLTDFELSQKLKLTIQAIRSKIPKVKIVILGPTPRWQGNPQAESFRYLRGSLDKNAEVPYLQKAEKLEAIDRILNAVAKDTDVEFISLNDELCVEDKCLARTGDDIQDFTAIDYGHLSKSGSEYLIKKISAKIF